VAESAEARLCGGVHHADCESEQKEHGKVVLFDAGVRGVAGGDRGLAHLED